jgi:calcyclin binding protein
MDPTAADLKELKRILAFGSTPYIENLLRAEIARLSAIFPEDPTPASAPVPVASPPKPAPVRKIFRGIDSYAFSDASETARIIISDVEGLDQAQIEFSPTERAFTITVLRESQGLPNLRLTVDSLKKIVPGESRYTKKGKTLTVILKKKKSATWTKLKKTKSGIKKPKPGETKKSDDPSAGLMDMMKKMYDEGDDEMKRTMQKAWWEAQNKKDKDKDKVGFDD